MSEPRSFVVGTIAYGASTVLLSLQGLIILPVFTRELTAGDYGIFTQLRVTAALLAPLVSLQMSASAVRFLAGERDPVRFRDTFWTPLVAFVPATMSLFVIAVFAADFVAVGLLGDGSQGVLVVWLGPWLVAQVLAAYFLNYYRIVRRMVTLSVLRLTQVLVATTALWLAIDRGYGVQGAVVAMTLSDSLFAGVYGLAVWWQIRVPTPVRLSQLGALLRYSLPLVAKSLLGWLVLYSDRLFIVHLLGARELGAYTVSYYIGGVITFLSGPLVFTLFPALTRRYEEQQIPSVRRSLRSALLCYLLVGIPATAGIAVVARPMTRQLATSEFELGGSVAFWVALGFLLQGCFLINRLSFELAKNTTFVSLASLFAAVVNIGLNAVLIPWLGVLGAAVATASTYGLVAAYTWYASMRIIRLEPVWRQVTKALVATLAMTLVLQFVPQQSWLGIIGAVGAGIGIYGVSLALLRTVTRDELTWLRHP